MSTEGVVADLPDGTPSALARLDGVLRGNLRRVGASVLDVALLPPRRAESTHRGLDSLGTRGDASLRYEVLSARGGTHATRVYEHRDEGGLVAVEESTLADVASPGVVWVHARNLGLLLPGNEVEYAERNHLVAGASSLRLSNAAWSASAAAAAASGLVARVGASGVASLLHGTGLPFLVTLALKRAIEVSPVDDEEADTVVRVLADLDSGVPVEWVARRLADRS